MSWLHKLVKEGKQVSRMGMIPAHHNFMVFGTKNDEECGLPKIWKTNGEENIKWLDQNKDKVIGTVYDMPPYKGKATIFVGLGPSINKQWKDLKEIDERFIIVATNSSGQFLLERGIIPHYVVAIDGRAGNWTMALGDKCKDVVGIFSACVDPQALKDWPGKIMIVPYGVDDKSLNSKIRRRFGKGVPSGGNTVNNAVVIFNLFTQSKIFIFIGHDMSFKDHYYADRSSKNDESMYFFMTDVNGKRVRTLIPLYEYKVWLENLMVQLYPEYYFFNCSEGILGVDVDGSHLPFVTHSKLDYAIKETKSALDIETSPLENRLKYIYDYFYDHDLGNQARGIGIWRFIDKYYSKFKKGLDVGCGRANGVQWARLNGMDVFGCDISQGATKCWEERGVLEYCKVAPAHNLPYKDQEFDQIVCSEVLEHIPEENIQDTLKEIFRVGSDKYFFTISLIPEKNPVAGYIQTHITVKPPEWWFEQFGKTGYTIAAAAHGSEMESMSIMAVRDEQPYIDGKAKIAVNEQGEPIIVVLGQFTGPGEELFVDAGDRVAV